MSSYIEVTFRDIAKMLASALPVEGEAFSLKVETYIEAIKKLPQEQKTALKVAYVFSRKVPKDEREDLYQDLALALIKAKTKDERLAYSIARCDWRDWWRKYKIRQHTSLDSVVEDDEGNPVTLGELIVGEVEFENKVDGELEAQRIWSLLPVHIKPLITKRLLGKALNSTERSQLNRYVKADGYKLLMV